MFNETHYKFHTLLCRGRRRRCRRLWCFFSLSLIRFTIDSSAISVQQLNHDH